MKRIGIILAAFVLIPALRVGAVTNTWVAGGTNDWSNTNSWSTTNVPAAGDDVIINSNNVGVRLTNATAYLSSILLSNKCTLIFSNWDTSLSATNITIQTNATLTCAGAFTNDAMSNRVWVVCSNLTVAAGGSINVDGKGYAKGIGSLSRNGQGPGGGGTYANQGAGGGHGGAGSAGYNGGGGGTYGSNDVPLIPGSGGGGDYGYNSNGADGGGAVRIDATGAVVVAGTISANGNSDGTGGRGGQGSGGAVYISCNTFTGTNGIIRANGGGNPSAGGSGGGGRIAVVYDQTAQAALPKPRVRFSTDRALGPYAFSGIGTVYFPDLALMDYGWMAHNGVLTVPDWTSWSVPSLLVTNGYMRISSGNPFTLTITNDLNIVGPTGIFWVMNGTITCGGNISITAISGSNSLLSLGTAGTPSGLTNVQSLYCAGNITLSTNTFMYIYSAITNAAQTNYGALVDVDGDISIATNAWIYSYSHNTNGGSVLFLVSNLTIAAGGGISANGTGWRGGYNVSGWLVNGYGPGGGYAGNLDGSGGGYGGRGGRSAGVSSRGAIYGFSNAPALPGSGGAARTGYAGVTGGAGGGLVRIEAVGSITNDGTITANGGTGSHGGGSGGGIYLRCLRFAGGTSGLLRADGASGGDADDGAGGGGRIAVWRRVNLHFYQGSYSVTNGAVSYTNDAGVGTVMLVDVPAPGTIIKMH